MTGVLIAVVVDLLAGVPERVGGGSDTTLVGFLTGVPGGRVTFFFFFDVDGLLVTVSEGGSGLTDMVSSLLINFRMISSRL